MNDTGMTVEGLKEQLEQLDRLLASSPEMEKRIQKIISKTLSKARGEISKQIHGSLPNDPRDAYKAVKTAVYKRILGGSVSILNRRKAGNPTDYRAPRKLRQGQRGGNRVKANGRTRQVQSYQGADRAFVLRFLNSGTADRQAGTRGGRLSGNRGHIAPRNLFSSRLSALTQYIDSELVKQFDAMLKELKKV